MAPRIAVRLEIVVHFRVVHNTAVYSCCSPFAWPYLWKAQSPPSIRASAGPNLCLQNPGLWGALDKFHGSCCPLLLFRQFTALLLPASFIRKAGCRLSQTSGTVLNSVQCIFCPCDWVAFSLTPFPRCPVHYSPSKEHGLTDSSSIDDDIPLIKLDQLSHKGNSNTSIWLYSHTSLTRSLTLLYINSMSTAQGRAGNE